MSKEIQEALDKAIAAVKGMTCPHCGKQYAQPTQPERKEGGV